MNELQVKTLTIEPAKIEFNHEQIEKELNKTLKKYDNLVYTEDGTSELRSVLAELRKGKKAISRYRIDTKKELNEPVNEFEGKCKSIESKFDERIISLDGQLKEFVKRERDEKQKQCEEIRDRLIKEYELNDENSTRIDIQDHYLTKSASLKQVEESMEFQAKNLKAEQDQKAANIEIIKTNVKLANAEYDLSLSVDAYVRLLEFDDVEKVKAQIESDAQKEVENREKIEQAKKEQAEREKQTELERIEREEKERIELEEMAVSKRAQEVAKSIEPVAFNQKPAKEVTEEPEQIEEIPFSDDPFMAGPFAEEKITHTVSITCTDSVFNKLVDFMSDNDIDWGLF